MSDPKPSPYKSYEEAILHFVSAWLMTPINNFVFKLSGGKIGGKFVGGAPVLLVTTTGRKSGKSRTFPLIYMQDRENLVLVASKGGSSNHPSWYLNLDANPDVEVQIGRDVRKYRARTANKDEKASLWPRLVQVYADYAAYQARSPRDIPVVILTPV